MVKIVDHAYEPESVIQSNQAKIMRALARNEKVVVLHSEGFVHGRLAGIPGVEYKVLKALPRRKAPAPIVLSDEDRRLLEWLTVDHTERGAYSGKAKGDVFIHWFYPERSTDRLSMCEVFHLNMLRLFNVMDRVERIHVRCACECPMTDAMEKAIAILGSGRAEVDFKQVPRLESWEHDTIKEAAEYAAETGNYVYYIHFKGASRLSEANLSKSGRENVNPLNVLYWSYIMYEGLFTDEPGTYKAIGPIACNRINKEYLFRDLSWTTRPEYQYIGSFQAFDGKALSKAFERLGLDKAKRAEVVWWGGRYTVEMFLCLIFLEAEVHAIAQMENAGTAYAMYTGGFCPAIRKRFMNLYRGQDAAERTGKGVSICAVAKDEDLYLMEWVNHYFKMGVSHIYLYDNNDRETDTIRRLGEMPNVTIIPLYGNALKEAGSQCGVYTAAYRKYGHMYEWMGFFDIDEFVTVDSGTIPEFLSDKMYDNVSVVHLSWRYHGDNGLERYDDRPVQERFAEPSPIDVVYSDKGNMENRYVKSFVRTGIEGIEMDIHSPRFFGALCRNSIGRFQYARHTLVDIEHRNARVEHYGTKTIEEYIRRRMPNGVDSPNGATGGGRISAKDRIDWFFRVNEMTPGKLKIIHEMLPDLRYKGA